MVNVLSQTASGQPLLLRYRSAELFILMTVCTAVFTDVFLYGMIVPIFPFTLSQRAGILQHAVQHWISILIAIYGCGLLVASPICGWFADRSKSRRLPLLFGLLALSGATAMLCVGNSIGLLVTGRLLQGISAAVVWTTGLALLADTMGPERIGQAVGYVSIAMSMGILLAPLLGGIVYAKGGYYSVFAMGFALIVVDIIFRLTLVEKKVAMKWTPTLDSPEIAIPNIPNLNSQDSKEPGALASGLAEPSAESRSMRSAQIGSSRFPAVITLLKSHRLLAALWGCMVQAALLTSFDTTLPLFVNKTFGWDSIGAGLIFLPFLLPTFASPLVGRLSDKYGSRWLIVTGFVVGLPFWVLLRLVRYHSVGQVALLCFLLAALGTSLTLILPPLLAEITYLVKAIEEKRPGLFGKSGAFAQAYGLFNCAYAAGTLVGPLWAGSVVMKAGWGTMAWSLGLLSVVSAVPALIFTGGFINHRHRDSTQEILPETIPEGKETLDVSNNKSMV